MPRTSYDNDYSKLYPGVDISDEVMAVLIESDRKIKYQEYDRKIERWRIDQETQSAVSVPSREDSLERLLDEDVQFASDGESIEDKVVRSVMVEKLRTALSRLNATDRALIQALFFDGFGEREYAKTIGLSKTALHARKLVVLAKLKRLLEAKK
jgi:DNA-directed RNA polymerase specialized sigma24 family protein